MLEKVTKIALKCGNFFGYYQWMFILADTLINKFTDFQRG